MTIRRFDPMSGDPFAEFVFNGFIFSFVKDYVVVTDLRYRRRFRLSLDASPDAFPFVITLEERE